MAFSQRAARILAAGGLAATLAVTSAIGQPIVGSGPRWAELSVAERQVLAPLAADWDTMEAQRRVKWLDIARQYPHMRPDEQRRLQSQMQAWSRLTPQQRQSAREQFKSLNQLPAEQRQDVQRKWQEYQKLPPEQRRQLATPPRANAPPTPGQHPADPDQAPRR